MSIVIQIGAGHLTASSDAVAPAPACIVETETIPDMGRSVEADAEVSMESEEEAAVVAAPVTSVSHTVREHKTTVHTSHHGYPSCYGLPYQPSSELAQHEYFCPHIWLDHNYGAPPPPTPPQSPPRANGTLDDDTSFSIISTTSTNNEEDAQPDSVTRCICGYDHDDEYMICCDRCSVWQHVDCMGLDRNCIPETYLCEKCEPRKVDRHKAKALQTRKKEEMAVLISHLDSSSEESEGTAGKGTGNAKDGKGKKFKMKRKRRERKNDSKTEAHPPTKKLKPNKRIKERMERKKAKLKRIVKTERTPRNKYSNVGPVNSKEKSKSENTNAADEEAQDAWVSNSNSVVEKYEEAMINQYTPEVQLLTGSLKLNGQHDELVRKVSEKVQNRLYKVYEMADRRKCLLAAHDFSENQPIIEYRGKFLSVSQFREQNPVFNKRLYPFVLFYKPNKEEDVCVDAREYGNEARFIRRSCIPNAEVRHVIQNGLLHLYIVSLRHIRKEEEITIPFDFDYRECINSVDCACGSDDCPVGLKSLKVSATLDRRKKGKRVSIHTEEDSSHSAPAHKAPRTPQKTSAPSQVQPPVEQKEPIQENVVSTGTETTVTESKPIEDLETEQEAAEKRRKMTREERKIDAIMKAFEKLERTQKRRQQALERMAQHRTQSKQTLQTAEAPSQQSPQQQNQSSIDITTSLEDIKEEERQEDSLPAEVATDESKETPPVDPEPVEESPPSAPQTVTTTQTRHKKGKRRRGSGTPAKRRTRTNSGGSDILSPDESLIPLASLVPSSTINSLGPDEELEIEHLPLSETSTNGGFVLPKSKRYLMQGWLQEKAETAVPVSLPLTIHTEMSTTTTSPTCYVRCTRDSLAPGGISAAHLRRNSTSSSSTLCTKSQNNMGGSAKKRWLRQAMFESGTSEPEGELGYLDGEHCSPIDNGCLSPTARSEDSCTSVSPPVPGDIVTPLKKRRLMRESMESDVTCFSPSATPSATLASPDSEMEVKSQQLSLSDDVMEESCDDCASPSVEVSQVDLKQVEIESAASEEVEVEEKPNVEESVKSPPVVVEEKEEEEEEHLPTDLVSHEVVPCSTTVTQNTSPIEDVMLEISAPADSTTITDSELNRTGCKIETQNNAEAKVTSVESHDAVSNCANSNPCDSSSVTVHTTLTDHVSSSLSPSSSSSLLQHASISKGNGAKDPVTPVKNSSSSSGTSSLLDGNADITSTSRGNGGCASGQKRKVSLSEYRMRMKENASRSTTNHSRSNPGTPTKKCQPVTPVKRSLSLLDQEIDETPEKEDSSEEEQWNHVEPKRERLSQRLRREFGLDDDSDSEREKNDNLSPLPGLKGGLPIPTVGTNPPTLGKLSSLSPVPSLGMKPGLSSPVPSTGSIPSHPQYGFSPAPPFHNSSQSYLAPQVATGPFISTPPPPPPPRPPPPPPVPAQGQPIPVLHTTMAPVHQQTINIGYTPRHPPSSSHHYHHEGFF